MRFTTSNFLFKRLFPKLFWNIPNQNNTIYLTFDDGPIPEITPWVLEVLKEENIKATFFCIGDNIKKNPIVFKSILENGHAIGNHTFNHLKGWQTYSKTYLENINLCELEIEKHTNLQTKLFRPPYGKMTPHQIKLAREKEYKIMMWEVLTYDFDENFDENDCYTQTIANTKSGSIIVFHDSIKANKNLKAILQKTIRELKRKGFMFDVLS